MDRRAYQPVLLFMGVMSVIGMPDDIKRRLEDKLGPIYLITEPFDFSFTSYYVPEMGEGIKRFFIAFENLIAPDSLASIKTFTNDVEKLFAKDGKRQINLDPGTISEANLILATTKNRSHRIAIGEDLFAEVTLIYQNHIWQALPWTYADYKSEQVQREMLNFRKSYLAKLKTLR